MSLVPRDNAQELNIRPIDKENYSCQWVAQLPSFLFAGLGVEDMLSVLGSAHIFFKEFVTVHFCRVCFLDLLFSGELFQ